MIPLRKKKQQQRLKVKVKAVEVVIIYKRTCDYPGSYTPGSLTYRNLLENEALEKIINFFQIMVNLSVSIR